MMEWEEDIAQTLKSLNLNLRWNSINLIDKNLTMEKICEKLNSDDKIKKPSKKKKEADRMSGIKKKKKWNKSKQKKI